MKITHLSAAAFGLALIWAGPGIAEGSKTPEHDSGHSHDHAHDHGQDHSHSHAADTDAQAIYAGYFDDAQVQDRPLSDWAGDWQSVYPVLQSGALRPVLAQKAKTGGQSEAELQRYYQTGYETQTDRIEISAETVVFHAGDQLLRGRYVSDGHEILTYDKGNRGVRFIFKKLDGDAGAPGFIQFSDHAIAPVKAGHYHLYWGDDRAELLAEVTHWPTYYPAALSADQIVDEMLAH